MKKPKLYNLKLTYSELYLIHDYLASNLNQYELILDSNPEDYEANVYSSIICDILNYIVHTIGI